MRWLISIVAMLAASSSFAQVVPLNLGEGTWDQRAAKPGLIWGSKIEIERQPCCEGSRTTSKDSKEAGVLAKEPQRAARDGKVLKLRLQDGRTLKITDCNPGECSGDEFAVHKLVDWWSLPGAQYYVVDVELNEAQMGFLIRESDGVVVRLGAAAVLSPSGRFAIAWHTAVIDGGPVMEVLDLRPNPPAISRVDLGPCPGRDKTVYPGPNPVWRNDREVVFDASTFFGEAAPTFRMTLRNVGERSQRWECQF